MGCSHKIKTEKLENERLKNSKVHYNSAVNLLSDKQSLTRPWVIQTEC